MNGNTIHPTNTTAVVGGGPAPARGWREFCELHAIATARQLAGHYRSFARERPHQDVLPPELFSKQFTDLFQQHFCCEVDKDGAPTGQNTCPSAAGNASSTTPAASPHLSQAVMGRLRITSASGLQDYREAGRPSAAAAHVTAALPKAEPAVVNLEQEQSLRCAAGNLPRIPVVLRGSAHSVGSGAPLIRSRSNEEVSSNDRQQLAERYSLDSSTSHSGNGDVTHFSFSQIRQTVRRLLKKRPQPSPAMSQDLNPTGPNPSSNVSNPPNSSDRVGGMSFSNELHSSSSSPSLSSSCLNSEATPPAATHVSVVGFASQLRLSLDRFSWLRLGSMRHRRPDVGDCCKEGQLRYLLVDDTISDNQPHWQRCRLLVRRIRDSQGRGGGGGGSGGGGEKYVLELYDPPKVTTLLTLMLPVCALQSYTQPTVTENTLAAVALAKISDKVSGNKYIRFIQ